MNIFAVFTFLFTQPITNALLACYHVLTFLHVPFALGFAIIALTVIIRIILIPLTASQIRASKKMQDLAPHLSNLKEKHKDDKKKHQEEMMKLYKEHGVGPASGCLPVLLQFPIIIGLYQALYTIVNASTVAKLAGVNKLMYFDFLKVHTLWDPTFFGISISLKPQDAIMKMPILIIIPIITVVLQLILSKMMMPEVPVKAKSDDMQATFAKQSLYLIPLMVGYFSFSLPVGLSLYWNTFSIFGIIQQYWIVGPGGAHHWFAKVNLHGKRS